MNKKSLSCEQIDKQNLVELYVAGKMPQPLREQFEQHLSHCENHAGAVLIEQSIRRGVQAYAREELKKRIFSARNKSENARIIILRFAAIFLAVVFTPVLLLYLFYEQKPAELAQRLDKDSIQVVSSPMKTEILKEKEGTKLKEGKSAVAISAPEAMVAQKKTKEIMQADEITIDENLAEKSKQSSGTETAGRGAASIAPASKLVHFDKSRDQIASVSLNAIATDTCQQKSLYEKILKNNELKMQTFFRKLEAPATRIEFNITVFPAGSVKNVHFINISKPLPLLEDSLRKSLLQLTFPKTNDTCEIRKTYIFQK
jgi:hypothetical protein